MTPENKLICPYTGNVIDLKTTGDGKGWIGVVSSDHGGYTTSVFPSKRAALFFLGMRDGVPVPGSTKHPEVIIRDGQVIEATKERDTVDQKIEKDRDDAIDRLVSPGR